MNDSIFTDYARKLEENKTATATLEKSLCYVNGVVPKDYIDEQARSFLEAMGKDTGESVMTRVISYVNTVTASKALKVTEERQLNAWFEDTLGPILNKYGYSLRRSFPNNKYSIFGSSRPDLAFTKHDEGQIVQGLINFQEKFESIEVEANFHGTEINLGTIEYKRNNAAKHACQCFADMIRVANDSVIQCLESGKLVKSVTVYALLASHDNLRCTPMKYYCNFKEPPRILIGTEQKFSELLYCILQS